MKDARRVAQGDWQTPAPLADAILTLLRDVDGAPRAVLEPTCGKGAFLSAAEASFPGARVVGYELDARYVREARAQLSSRSMVEQGDFFRLPWSELLDALPEPLLVVGNPPWVTSATLGALEARNLPEKTNFKRLSGLDALTGASNFDIAEWMILHLLERLVGRRFTLAMLCKTSVARRVIEHVARDARPFHGELRRIDAQRHFAAAVDATLLIVRGGVSAHETSTWPVFDALDAHAPSRVMGVHAGRVVPDHEAHARTRALEGTSKVIWRSGIKHDCAKVMELRVEGDAFVNGLGERVDVEREHVFPLLKGADVANERLSPRRALIVTQRALGEDTRALEHVAPRLWAYLDSHHARLAARKSRIYRDAPRFAIFGVGAYAFAPYKVAVCGLYKRLTFTLVGPHAGLPVALDDTSYFLPFEREQDARACLVALRGERAREFFEARVFWDAKRPISKALLASLSLDALLRA